MATMQEEVGSSPSYTRLQVHQARAPPRVGAARPTLVVPVDEDSEREPAVHALRRHCLNTPASAIVLGVSLGVVLALVAIVALVSGHQGAQPPPSRESALRELQEVQEPDGGNFWDWLNPVSWFGFGGEETSTTTTTTITTTTRTGTTTSTATSGFRDFAFSTSTTTTTAYPFKVRDGSPAALLREQQLMGLLSEHHQTRHEEGERNKDPFRACTRSGGNCWETHCCEQQGLYCFEKTHGLAACKAACEPGPDLSDHNSEPWTCNPLGAHTSEHLNLSGPLADWVQDECADSNEGDSCYESKCCREPGMRCYLKVGNAARCRAECTPGVDPTDVDDKPWSCQPLGPSTPGSALKPVAVAADWVVSTCSKVGSDCFRSGCCAAPGMQCYLKDATSKTAGCKASCTPGIDLQDVDSKPWNCTALGTRTPGEPEEEGPFDASELPSWVSEDCAKAGENCADSSCCADPGHRCYIKSRNGKDGPIEWASCRVACTPGPDMHDVDANPWDCEALGPRTPGEATAYEAEEAPRWVKESCSPTGESCQETRCCQDAGMQCYEKTKRTAEDKGWAACKATCEPGADYFDVDPTPWTCKELGPRTPGKGEDDRVGLAEWTFQVCTKGDQSNCLETGCCQDDGMRCYKKNSTFGVCKQSCAANKSDPIDGRPWSCEKVGGRHPGRPPCVEDGENCQRSMCCKEKGKMCFARDDEWAECLDTCDPYAEGTKAWNCAPIGIRQYGRQLGCSWPGEDCGLTKVCCQEGQSCRVKDEHFAGCTLDKDVVEADWDGTVIGGARVKNGVPGINGSRGSNYADPSWDNPAGTRLYCFMAVMTGTYEEQLMELMQEQQTHVFGCDINDVLDSSQSKQEAWGSVSNTDVFIRIWKLVIAKNRFQDADWTVKVDPDAVFFPDRLRDAIKDLSAPANEPIYLKNSFRFTGFLGAVEIFSRTAVELYSEFGVLGCHMMEAGSGEDGYFKACMDSIGAKFMFDDSLLHSSESPSECDKPNAVLHPFKDPDKWSACYNKAVSANPAMPHASERQRVLTVTSTQPEDPQLSW